MRTAFGAIALFIFIAGCSESAPLGRESSQPIDGSVQQLLLTGCDGGLARMQVPEQSLHVPVPPGWEGENGLPTTVTLFAFACDHVSIGQFERGPVDFVVESHGKFNAPMNCRLGEYDILNVMTRMIWSDAEIANAVTKILGIPTSVGIVSLDGVGDSRLGTSKISWIVDGQGSSFTLGKFDNEYTRADTVWRYVWPAENRLGVMEMNWVGSETWLEPTATHGAFRAPMLLAATGLPLVVGTGAAEADWAPAGNLKFYEGFECANELSPS